MPSRERTDETDSPTPGPRPGQLSALLQELVRGSGGAAAEWNHALAPGMVVGRFELERELGRGGSGVVYEARDTQLGRRVAFKAVRATRRVDIEQRFLEEAELAARLSHPNLVTLYDVGRSEHGPYLVLELLRGRTLAAQLDEGPIPVTESLRIAAEVASGLAHAHSKGIVHRDLTPGNVFLCDGGAVKVLDLGLAHAFGHRRVDGGTPGYMAPEQRRGAPEDERTDVFALGAVLFRMLTGHPPPAPAGARPPRAPALDVPGAPALGPLIARMLHTDPVERPRDAGEVLAALQTVRREVERGRDASGTVVIRRTRSLRMGALVVAGALLGVVVAVLVPRPWARTPLGTTPPPSIAVLPFANLSADASHEYFSDGLSEEILNALARVHGLRVTGRTSSFAFKGKNEDVRTIAEKLGVGTVLEGSVRREGSRLRITAQLVSARDGYQLWSQAYDREAAGIFAVQSDIARSVATAMHMSLVSGPQREPEGRETTPEAYDHFLRGLDLSSRGGVESFARAAEEFSRALALDPRYARAHAWRAIALTLVTDFSEARTDQERAATLARIHADRAMALAPEGLDACLARGYVRMSAWEWQGALEDLERAVSLAPGSAHVRLRYAAALAALGRLPQALEQGQLAAQLDPLLARAWAVLAQLHDAAGGFEEARRAARRALELVPDNFVARRELGFASLLAGDPAAALATFEESGVEWIQLLGRALVGRSEDSDRALRALEATPGMAYQVAQVRAWRGERDEAFAWLERAFAAHDAGLRMVRYDPLLRGLRDDARFGQLVRKLNLPAD